MNRGATVYLAAADQDGMMVSLIQSNYHGFGSGVVVPGTGIALNNRGSCFVTQAGHPNRVGPSKRPLNTIIPGFITKDGAPFASFGVMGGTMQPQGHTQVASRMLASRPEPAGGDRRAALARRRRRGLGRGSAAGRREARAHRARPSASRGHAARIRRRADHPAGREWLHRRLGGPPRRLRGGVLGVREPFSQREKVAAKQSDEGMRVSESPAPHPLTRRLRDTLSLWERATRSCFPASNRRRPSAAPAPRRPSAPRRRRAAKARC